MEGSAFQRSRHGALVPLTASALLFLALAPSWLRVHGDGIATMAIAAFFSKLCHQRPDRALYLLGAPTAVCVRCLGIYAGAAIGSFLRPQYRTALLCLGVALSLNGLDVAAESLGLHGNMPLLRFLMGAGLGIAVGAMFAISAPAQERLFQADTRSGLR